MSTPISTLPMKTQQSGAAGGAGDTNDINDPIVQDVLNEFQEELMISKQPKSSQFSQSMPPQMPPSHMLPPPQYPPSPYPSMAYPPHSPNMNGGHGSNNNNNSKYDNISSYLDTDVAKRSLILVILAVIIYHSGIINTVYEKMPEYLHENLSNFDIYIKSVSLFSIIYVLSFFEYI
jgi:hypothetical protein